MGSAGCGKQAGMRRALKPHPDSPASAATGIEAEVASRGGGLLFSYLVRGRIAALRIPPVTAAARTDELWRHTCFEAFVRTSSGPAYYEFNFSPSTQWAAYRFGGYRKDGRAATEISPPRIHAQSSATSFALQATLELGLLPSLSDGPWHIGLSAVIEDTAGRKSYWALAHRLGKPDFHHPDGFTYEFSPERG
jgi:hypothetical protein